ncbi:MULTISPECIES: hypothetical protein [Marinobacter]|uniref:hypothetical protein n=1 Tax=Marinobacter TaxID=2742 RepID=UPI000F85C6DA|nr:MULTISPECIES: hypothetical protein [Marinobacter]MDC8454723.1 hypothetical protein [Marinobacter sp. DS40M6]MDP4532698.1 hypothetical protein [Marinobacter salarius]VVT32554.1 conserved hypothetical protein [Marinobacter salarius]VXA93329.1 conserved hypothetical protein [Marinobacter salarius]
MPRSITPKAIVNLLLLIMVIQPVLAFGQFTADATEHPARFSQLATMDCCNAGLASNNGRSEQNMACGDMTSVDCAIAANQGNCGTMLCALVSEKAVAPVQSLSDPAHRRPHEGYLSIILDTLTPPPNSSKA